MNIKCLAAAAAVAFLPAATEAHVSLERDEAPVDSTYKAVLRVGHGCEGSPTIALRVQIPEGVIAVKPMPHPGWTLSTVTGAYERAYDYYGQSLSEGVKEIAWTDGNLPDDWYDEFVFRARLPKAASGTVIHFPVVQLCASGEHRWIEIPAEGQDPDSLEEPAPSVTLTAPLGDH